MIAVIGSELDAAAGSLVKAWAGSDAVLLSAQDLCSRGWVFHTRGDDGGMFVAGGLPRPTAALRGVLVRRPAVVAEELPWIAAEDRQYVATEINAFLVAWLASLACPVLNRPTPTSLCGPAWSQTYWQVAAARAGVDWAEPGEAGEAGTVREIVFCGGLHQGRASRQQCRAAARLAAASGTALLGLRFAGDAVAAVTLQPRLEDPAVRALVLGCLAGRVAA